VARLKQVKSLSSFMLILNYIKLCSNMYASITIISTKGLTVSSRISEYPHRTDQETKNVKDIASPTSL